MCNVCIFGLTDDMLTVLFQHFQYTNIKNVIVVALVFEGGPGGVLRRDSVKWNHLSFERTHS